MAEVSGPGALSQRTDMGNLAGSLSPDAPNYGEVGDLQQLATAAPLSQQAPGSAPANAQGRPQVTPLGAPTAMPDQHVTDGVTAQPGSSASGYDQDKVDIRAMDPKLVNALLYQASVSGASPTFQRYVRELYSQR